MMAVCEDCDAFYEFEGSLPSNLECVCECKKFKVVDDSNC